MTGAGEEPTAEVKIYSIPVPPENSNSKESFGQAVQVTPHIVHSIQKHSDLGSMKLRGPGEKRTQNGRIRDDQAEWQQLFAKQVAEKRAAQKKHASNIDQKAAKKPKWCTLSQQLYSKCLNAGGQCTLDGGCSLQ